MPGRLFIWRILIIILMLQMLLILCSCSRNRKGTLPDYGEMSSENILFSYCCEPVPYPEKNPENSKDSFPPARAEESPPAEAAPEAGKQFPDSLKPDIFAENTEEMACDTDAGITEIAEKKSFHLPDMPFYKEYSRKLGIELDGTENRKLIMAVAEWMGTPYLWGGCSIKGVDCSCLVKNIYEDVYGIELRRTSMMMCNADFMPVEKERLREGDIICFGTKEDDISHVGLYLKDNKFVHASQSGGVRISSLERNYFKKRLIMAGRAIRPLEISLARLSISELVVVNR